MTIVYVREKKIKKKEREKKERKAERGSHMIINNEFIKYIIKYIFFSTKL